MNIALQRSDQAIDVLIGLREQHIAIESMTVQKPSLDEVFLALTGHDTERGRRRRRLRRAAGRRPLRGPGGRPMSTLTRTPEFRVDGAHAVQPRQPGRHGQPDDDDGLARDAEDAPQLRAVLRRDHPAAAVHRDVRLHLRRRGLRRRGLLPADPDPRADRPDRPHGLRRHRRPAPRGHGQGRLRPVPGAADRPDRAAGRPDGRRHAPLRDRRDPDLRDRHRHGLPPRRRRPRRVRRDRARRSSPAGRWPGCSPGSAPSARAPRSCRATR